MLPSFLRMRSTHSLRVATFWLCLATSVAAISCGQEGMTSTNNTGGEGGNGASGGNGTTASTGGEGGGGSTGVGGAETAEPLKVVNWNLHNFFDKKKDTSSPDEFVLTATQYNDKRASIGAILKEINADIAILPEVENKEILDDLNTNVLNSAYSTAITQTNDFRGLDIGILSKIPIVDVVTHTADTFKRLDIAGGASYKYSRDAVEIHFKYNTRSIVLLGVHYRSKGNGMVETDDKDKRMAEAQQTRYIADQIYKADPKTAIMILGDFNDTPDSPPVKWTLAGDPKNAPMIPFFSTAESAAEGERYTFVYNGVKELIDYQMTNKLLSLMLDKASAGVRHGTDVEEASDHFPLYATYQIQ